MKNGTKVGIVLATTAVGAFKIGKKFGRLNGMLEIINAVDEGVPGFKAKVFEHAAEYIVGKTK